MRKILSAVHNPWAERRQTKSLDNLHSRGLPQSSLNLQIAGGPTLPVHEEFQDYKAYPFITIPGFSIP